MNAAPIPARMLKTTRLITQTTSLAVDPCVTADIATAAPSAAAPPAT